MHSIVCHQDHATLMHIYSVLPAFYAMRDVHRAAMRKMGCIKQWLAMASCVRMRSQSLPPGSGEEIDDRRAWSCCKSIIFLISSVSFPRSCSAVCGAICWWCSPVVAEGCAVDAFSRLQSRPPHVHTHRQCASSILCGARCAPWCSMREMGCIKQWLAMASCVHAMVLQTPEMPWSCSRATPISRIAPRSRRDV